MDGSILRLLALGCPLALLGCETTIRHDISGLACPGEAQVRTVSGECICIDESLALNPGTGECEQPPFASILFVMDNSGSMGGYQRDLASSVAGLAAILDAASVNYRIGFTTTDNGNPLCSTEQTTPERGELLFGSCRQRLSEFVLSEGAQDLSFACEDVCEHSSIAVLPTAVEGSSDVAPRPWLEVAGGASNVAVAVSDALRCAAPQGVSGCGFESHLASAARALERARTPGDPNYGFLAGSALTAIVFVTDEADCSYNPSAATIFSAQGDRTFWSDPSAMAPNSAVCWNAGVSCVGAAHDYTCDASDKDPLGAAVSNAADASLVPVSTFIESISSAGPLLAFGVYGQQQGGDYVYREGNDHAFTDAHGIGPGCVNAGQGAVPPVRLREFVEALSPEAPLRSAFSICEDDLSPALDEVAFAIASAMEDPWSDPEPELEE